MAESSGSSRNQKSFRHFTRNRLLKEMLASVKTGDSPKDWKVLVFDEFTVKVMSSSCKMADITDEGISLVEDLNKKRQPMPTLEAVYFIQAATHSINKFIEDMSGKRSMYKRAYVFISSPMTPELLQLIKSDKTVLSRIAALKEMNLEYITMDSQGFVTDNVRALEQLFGEQGDTNPEYETCIETVAYRLATVFASLKEFPCVRYRAPKASTGEDDIPPPRELVATKLAAAVWDRITKYKSTLVDFPRTETCDLIIVDRSLDPIAPFIHEWSYDAICHDLLGIEGNKYVYEATSGSKSERKEVILEEHDPVWLELRFMHFAEVFEQFLSSFSCDYGSLQANLKLTDKMNEFGSKNKAAQIRLGAKEGQEISTKDMQKLVQALPQFREQLDKLSLHIQIATVLNERIAEQSLSDIASLEQDFAFGGGSSKELVKLFNTKQDMTLDNKLRLLLIYAASYPDKLDATKLLQWMKLAKLGGDEINMINNLRFLGVPIVNKQAGGFFKSGARKVTPRKERKEDDDAWQFSRFYPLIEEVAEEFDKGELSKEDYPYVKEPSAKPAAAEPPTSHQQKVPQSMRTTKSTWATKRTEDSENAAIQNKRRLFVFMIGGATRVELKAVHKLMTKLKREVILGSTSLDEPHQFLENLKSLSKIEEVDIGDIDID